MGAYVIRRSGCVTAGRLGHVQNALPASTSPSRVRLRLPDVPLLPGRSAAQTVLQPSTQSALPRHPGCVGIGKAVRAFVLAKLT